jgi:hypothetical protein
MSTDNLHKTACHGRERTEAKRGPDVGPQRCLSCDSEDFFEFNESWICTKCWTDYWHRRIEGRKSVEDVIVYAVVTKSWEGYGDWWREHLARLGIEPRLVVLPDMPVEMLWRIRLRLLKCLLEVSDRPVLMSDVDTLWLDDPRPVVVANWDAGYDYVGSKGVTGNFCMGFCGWLPTAWTREFLTECCDELDGDPALRDQAVVNALLAEHFESHPPAFWSDFEVSRAADLPVEFPPVVWHPLTRESAERRFGLLRAVESRVAGGKLSTTDNLQ